MVRKWLNLKNQDCILIMMVTKKTMIIPLKTGRFD